MTTARYVSMDNDPVVSRIYGKMNRWDLVNLSHQFPEWRNPEGSALPISYEDILRAGNKSEEDIAATEAELDSLAAAESLLQPA